MLYLSTDPRSNMISTSQYSKEKHANQLEHPNAGEHPPFRKQKKQLLNISKSKEKDANQLEQRNAGEQPPFRKQKKTALEYL